VVGAGPVGLTVGVELWRRGVPCRVIDRLVEPARYAKAVGVQPRTLEVWENFGVLRDAYLVRPDGYVGFRAAPLTCAGLRSHLDGVFAVQPVPGPVDHGPGPAVGRPQPAATSLGR